MGAKIEVAYRTLSKRPRRRLKKEFVEGDLFREEIQITNDSSDPFPPSDMMIITSWTFPTTQVQGQRIRLSAGQLQPGETVREVADHHVLAPGYALLNLHYTPYGDGCFLHNPDGSEINPLDPKAHGLFRGVSRMELYTLGALYWAVAAALLAAIGLILTVLLGV